MKLTFELCRAMIPPASKLCRCFLNLNSIYGVHQYEYCESHQRCEKYNS